VRPAQVYGHVMCHPLSKKDVWVAMSVSSQGMMPATAGSTTNVLTRAVSTPCSVIVSEAAWHLSKARMKQDSSGVKACGGEGFPAVTANWPQDTPTAFHRTARGGFTTEQAKSTSGTPTISATRHLRCSKRENRDGVFFCVIPAPLLLFAHAAHTTGLPCAIIGEASTRLACYGSSALYSVCDNREM
jgi:hypothetical protein